MFTVTVILPARNEAKNLPDLLQDIRQQSFGRGVELIQILVLSDGSTDTTVSVVKQAAIEDSRITVRAFRTSKGKAVRLNQAFRQSTTDAVLILDADIRLPSKTALRTLLAPVKKGTADLTSATVIASNNQTWVQKMLTVSMEFKQAAYAAWKQGNNIYTCHGRARALSQRFYQHLLLQHSYNEDSFSYLACVSKDLRYQFVQAVQIHYTLPKIFSDHVLQSERFFISTDLLSRSFPDELVHNELAIPKLILVRHFIHAVAQHPVWMTLYVCTTFYTYIHSKLFREIRHSWQMATTSK